MVILLAISTVVAVLAPGPAGDSETEETDEPETERPDEGPGWGTGGGEGDVRRIELASGGEHFRLSATVGEHLYIEVSDRRGRQIAIPELGLLEASSPAAPATFDLFARRPERVEIVALGPREEIAELVITP